MFPFVSLNNFSRSASSLSLKETKTTKITSREYLVASSIFNIALNAEGRGSKEGKFAKSSGRIYIRIARNIISEFAGVTSSRSCTACVSEIDTGFVTMVLANDQLKLYI